MSKARFFILVMAASFAIPSAGQSQTDSSKMLGLPGSIVRDIPLKNWVVPVAEEAKGDVVIRRSQYLRRRAISFR